VKAFVSVFLTVIILIPASGSGQELIDIADFETGDFSQLRIEPCRGESGDCADSENSCLRPCDCGEGVSMSIVEEPVRTIGAVQERRKVSLTWIR